MKSKWVNNVKSDIIDNALSPTVADGHLSLPEEIKEEMGLMADSRVRVVLEREVQREKARIDHEISL